MGINKICFLAGEYPTHKKPKSAVFYQHLIHQFADMGIECRVIYPFPINYEKELYESERIDVVNDANSVKVYRPKSITLGAKNIGRWNTAYLSALLYTKSAVSLLNKIGWEPDAFYGHFISPAGIMAARLSKKTGIPAFVAYGESEPWSIKTIGINRSRRELASINGFISVSEKNKQDLLKYKISNEDKIDVFPNSINNKHFYKRDKAEARKKMGWDKEKFIVAFVGHFNHRKGVLRLDEAISNIPGAYVAYAGSGNLIPKSPNIVYNGNVSPELMPWFLSAADIFVLPTLNEGSCNAIIEAMACGLPIVSSDKEFNYDILSNDNAILINPENTAEIENAIIKLMNSERTRMLLSDKSLEQGKELNIEERAKKILKWMEAKS